MILIWDYTVKTSNMGGEIIETYSEIRLGLGQILHPTEILVEESSFILFTMPTSSDICNAYRYRDLSSDYISNRSNSIQFLFCIMIWLN